MPGPISGRVRPSEYKPLINIAPPDDFPRIGSWTALDGETAPCYRRGPARRPAERLDRMSSPNPAPPGAMSTIDRLASPLAGDDALDPEDWAVVHDFLMVNGGAEAVTRRFCTDVLPGSPLWYLAGNEAIAAAITDGDRRQVLGPAVTGRNYRALAPMIPMMLKTLTPTRQNLLVSSYAFAAGVPTLGRKVVYCHSPLRQAWSGAAAYTKQGPLLERLGTRL